MNSFLHFLGELEDTKSPFEIILPLSLTDAPKRQKESKWSGPKSASITVTAKVGAALHIEYLGGGDLELF